MSSRSKSLMGALGKSMEELDEGTQLLLQQQTVCAPIVWCRLASGFKIQDLNYTYYNVVVDLIKRYYIHDNVLCKTSGLLDDFVSRRSFYQACLFQMKDMNSLVAIDECKNQVAGICLLKAVPKFDFGRIFSRTILRQGEGYNKCMDLKTALNRKVDIYAEYNCEIFFRIYSICIKPEYREKGLGFALFKTSLRIARCLNIPIMMGIFDCHKMQQHAKKLGFFTVAEIRYSDWKDEHGNIIFSGAGLENETCALMLARVEAEVYPEFLIEKDTEPETEGLKKSKKDKKDKKAGKKKGKK